MLLESRPTHGTEESNGVVLNAVAMQVRGDQFLVLAPFAGTRACSAVEQWLNAGSQQGMVLPGQGLAKARRGGYSAYCHGSLFATGGKDAVEVCAACRGLLAGTVKKAQCGLDCRNPSGRGQPARLDAWRRILASV